MNDRPVDIAATDAPVSRFDTVIEWLMIALLAFMPLAFGAVEAWSEMAVICLAGAMALCLGLKLTLRRGSRIAWSWAYVPMGLFLLLAALQLVPLPTGLVSAVSANTASTKTSLLGDLPDAAERLTSMTISFYPLATKHDLRLLLAVAVVFFVVVNVYRRPEQIKRLLGAVAIIGGGIALLALAQVISRTGKIYWLVPTGTKIADAGTFVNHSNYSQFMNLSIGAALGLLIVKLHEGFQGVRVTLPGVFERLAGPKGRIVWYLVGGIALAAATVFLSLSRGGAVALLIAGAFTALVIASKRALGGRGWIMAVMALGAFVCVLYVGFDAVYDRLSTLREMREYGGRWQIVKDIGLAWTRFPAVGTGLGTHEVVYPMFDRSTTSALAAHAENEYAQAAEETGIIGLGLLIAFGAIVWAGYARCVRRIRLPIRSAAFGLGFGLVAIIVHSFSDFGQHLPANASLSAVSCGLLVALARMGRHNPHGPAELAIHGRYRPLAVAVLAGVIGLWGWAILGANDARCAEAHWEQALRVEDRLRKDGWLGSNDDYAALISEAAAAADCEPGNVKYHHWMNVYRWRSISRVVDPQTGKVVVTPRILEFTQRIVKELHAARALCPTFGATYCMVGQLEKFILNRPVGTQHIQTGYELAPCDPTACFVAGLLDAEQGKADDSLEKLRRAVALDGGLFREAVDVYARQTNRADLAVALAGDDAGRLFHVARVLSDSHEHNDLAARARTKAVAALKARCRQPDASAGELASMASLCRQDKNYAEAVAYYRRALALDYGQVGWRLGLARALAETGQVSEAMQEARICLRLRPQMTAARKLIEKLSVLPAAPGQ